MLGITVTTVLLLTAFGYFIRADNIWWHLKMGQLIVDLRQLPETNTFSFTAPDHPWIAQEWASEVFFYAVYNLLGYRGLVATALLLNAIACALVYLLTERFSRAPFASALVTMLAALLMLSQFSLRPYLFGNLFFVIALYLMEKPSAGGRLRPVLVFCLFGIWANFHSSFLIGLAMILLYAAAAAARRYIDPKAGKHRSRDTLDFELPPPGRLAGDFLVALAACMATPNHVFGLIFPLAYVKEAFSTKINYLTNFSEWRPAGLESPLGRMVTFYLLFCGFAIAGSRKSPRPIHVGLLVAFAAFAYSSVRNIPLLGIAATPVLAGHLPQTLGFTWKFLPIAKNLRSRFEQIHAALLRVHNQSRAILLPSLAALFLLVCFSVPPDSKLSYGSLTGLRSLADLSPDFYPTRALDYLSRLDGRRRLFNYINWGGAVIWHLYPNQRVFIDQRHDCYPAEVFADYFAVHRLDRDWRSVLERWRIDTVMYPRRERLTKELMRQPGWAVVYQDERAVVLERIVNGD